jgi:hypothetical protein
MATADGAEIHRFFAPRLDGTATGEIMSGAELRMTGVVGANYQIT